MKPKDPRGCAFCSRTFDSKTKRAKEHVLRLKMLKQLGHEKQMLNPSLTDRYGRLVSQRFHAADNLLAGDVCEHCNSGWINDLDKKVEPLLLNLSRSEILVTELKPEEKMSLSWWCLKTACTFTLTERPERRHIKKSIYNSAMNQEVFPEEIVVVGSNFNSEKGAYAVNVDMWEIGFKDDYIQQEDYNGFKIGIQYDNLLLLAAHFSRPGFSMHLNPMFHQEILHSSCKHTVGFDGHNHLWPPQLPKILIHNFCYRVSAIEI